MPGLRDVVGDGPERHRLVRRPAQRRTAAPGRASPSRRPPRPAATSPFRSASASASRPGPRIGSPTRAPGAGPVGGRADHPADCRLDRLARDLESQSTSASGGSLRYGRFAGASATYTFTGSSVAWVASRGPDRGSARVYVDGVYARRSASATSTGYRSVVFARNFGTTGATRSGSSSWERRAIRASTSTRSCGWRSTRRGPSARRGRLAVRGAQRRGTTLPRCPCAATRPHARPAMAAPRPAVASPRRSSPATPGCGRSRASRASASISPTTPAPVWRATEAATRRQRRADPVLGVRVGGRPGAGPLPRRSTPTRSAADASSTSRPGAGSSRSRRSGPARRGRSPPTSTPSPRSAVA